MPRLSYRAPKCAFHKASGQAVVRINGKLVYLGLWGSKESRARYKQAVTQWADDRDREAAAVAVVAKSEPESSTTLVELLAEFLDHAETFYVKNGKPTSMVPIIRRMLRLWREMFGAVVVRDIKPSHLKALQARMVKDGQARSYVTKLTAATSSILVVPSPNRTRYREAPGLTTSRRRPKKPGVD